MGGILILYLSWHPASPFANLHNGSSTNNANPATPGSSGDSGLTDGSAGGGAGGGGGGTFDFQYPDNPTASAGGTYEIPNRTLY